MCASPEGRKHGVSKGRVANSCPLTYNSIVVCKYLPSVCARLALLGFPRAIVIYSAHICLYMNGLEKCILLIIGHSDDIGVSAAGYKHSAFNSQFRDDCSPQGMC